MSKQTAVQWLTQILHNRRNGIYDGHPYLSVQQLCEIALAMERKQIIEAVQEGYDIDRSLHKWKWVGAEYYKETYGKEASNEF